MERKGSRFSQAQKNAVREGSQKKSSIDRIDKLKDQIEEDVNKKRLSIYSIDGGGSDQVSKQVSGKKITLIGMVSSRAIDKPSESQNTSQLKPGSLVPPSPTAAVELEEKADISSSLIAQHFSILRELYQYCTLFKENVLKDQGSLNTEETFRSLQRLIELLEAGCDFLNYPLKL